MTSSILSLHVGLCRVLSLLEITGEECGSSSVGEREEDVENRNEVEDQRCSSESTVNNHVSRALVNRKSQWQVFYV